VTVPTLSELEQKRVWDGWLSAEIATLYFADLAGVYRHRRRLTTWLVLLLSSGAATAAVGKLTAEWSSWLAVGLALLAAALSGYDLVADNQKHEGECRELHFRWNRLASAYERLWDDMYTDDAAARLDALERRTAELSKASTAFPAQRWRLERWQTHVEMQHGARGVRVG
jgi:hypothetical protein